jgi:hypothetical protein
VSRSSVLVNGYCWERVDGDGSIRACQPNRLLHATPTTDAAEELSAQRLSRLKP